MSHMEQEKKIVNRMFLLKLALKRELNTNSVQIICRMQIRTRCSAIAEKPRCRVRYSFRQK